MKFNESIEHFVKRIINGAKVNNDNDNDDSKPPLDYQVCIKQFLLLLFYLFHLVFIRFDSQYKRKSSTPMLHGGSKFRQGLLQLMIHSIDPLYEEQLQMTTTTTTTINDEMIASKTHVHPPGAAFCPICGEDKHEIRLDSNGIFHTHDHHHNHQNHHDDNNNQNNGNYHDHKDGIVDNNNIIRTNNPMNGNLVRQDTVSII